MEPIFNKKVAEKCNLWDREQCTYALFTVDKVNYCRLKKKKEKKKRGKRREETQTPVSLQIKRSLRIIKLNSVICLNLIEKFNVLT